MFPTREIRNLFLIFVGMMLVGSALGLLSLAVAQAPPSQPIPADAPLSVIPDSERHVQEIFRLKQERERLEMEVALYRAYIARLEKKLSELAPKPAAPVEKK